MGFVIHVIRVWEMGSDRHSMHPFVSSVSHPQASSHIGGNKMLNVTQNHQMT